MDGMKTQVPDWPELLSALRDNGQSKQAYEIEKALSEGKKIKAIKLAKACGIIAGDNSA